MDLLRSLPIGLYLEKPITWLHQLDPRVKLGWLLSFLLAPIAANSTWRITLVLLLIFISIVARIPWRALKKQMGWLLLIGGLIFIIALIAPDSLNITHRPRLPKENLVDFPQSYQYVLFQVKEGFVNLRITRKSLDLAIYGSTLIFTLIYSTTIYLLTTSPEEITSGIEKLMQPLKRFNIPVTEIALTLTLSLRFIPLVLEEVQNLIRAVYTRGINWKKLGIKNSLKIWLAIVEKLLENLLMRAEQIATAMEMRGFTSPNTHKVDWYQLKITPKDLIALSILILFWCGRIYFGSSK
jgi:energy-coupling factor transport system permease protein